MSRESRYYQNGEDLSFQKTTHEEERELFRRAKAGDAGAREQLIKSYLLFVASYGAKCARGNLQNDEIVSAMNEALMKAIDKFDPEYKNRFARFLTPFLRGAMSRLWSSKNIVDLPPEMKKPDWDIGPSCNRFLPMSAQENPEGEGPGEGRSSKKEGTDEFALADSGTEPDEAAEESDQKSFLFGMIESFRSRMTPEESEILDLVYRDGLNFAEAGEKRGVSREWIRVKHDGIIKKLRLWFKKEGVTTQ